MILFIAGPEICLLCRTSRPAVGPTQPPVQWWLLVVCFPRLKQLGNVGNHAHVSGAEVRTEKIYTAVLQNKGTHLLPTCTLLNTRLEAHNLWFLVANIFCTFCVRCGCGCLFLSTLAPSPSYRMSCGFFLLIALLQFWLVWMSATGASLCFHHLWPGTTGSVWDSKRTWRIHL
jgi:hypothetical protein